MPACPQNSDSILKVTIHNILLEEAGDVSNENNIFFVQVAENITEPILSSYHKKLRTFYCNRIPRDLNFNIPLLKANKVEVFLKSIDTTKATGTGNIGPRLLKIAATETADNYFHLQLFNKSIFIS